MLARVLALLALCGLSHAAELPAIFQTCHVNDVDFNTCLAKAIEDALYKLKDGEETLGLAPIGPLHVVEMSLDLGEGPISFALKVRDLVVAGMENTTIVSVELDPKKHVLVMKFKLDHLRLDFQYTASGHILVVPIKGGGPAFFEMDNLFGTHIVSTEPVEREGKTYWTIANYTINIEPKAMRCHFDDILKGNSEVSDKVNGFLNSEWKLFYKQIQGPAEEAYAKLFKHLASRVFDQVPITDIFRDI
ncbi:protein takeout-like [Frankliniella occidentalis]|uniref:Protein takeout-like n=1 Tax=Frankliniella occidentalis TaxID=133901 RepID=A0A6J1T6Y4_FRAOC|nr:protein takeout-like [Frankliniella occidentalis]